MKVAYVRVSTAEQYRQYYPRKLSKTEWAKKIGVSRSTLDRLISEFEAECE